MKCFLLTTARHTRNREKQYRYFVFLHVPITSFTKVDSEVLSHKLEIA